VILFSREEAAVYGLQARDLQSDPGSTVLLVVGRGSVLTERSKITFEDGLSLFHLFKTLSLQTLSLLQIYPSLS
jgi:hypothetical protein